MIHPGSFNNAIVYRVEDAEGYGYKRTLDSDIGSVTCIEWRGYEERRPLPKDDGIDIDALGDDWFFGFESIDALKNWFYLNERNAGAKFDGKILVIEAEPNFIVKGGRQLAFHKDHAKTVGIHAMNAFDTPENQAVPFDDDDGE
jgi:hypothetical protein